MKSLWMALLLVGLATAEEADKPGVNDDCARFCKQKYAGSDGDQKEMSACEEGCRVFSMLQFVSGAGKDDAVRTRCESGCKTSFSDERTQTACQSGCANQVAFTGGKMEISMDSDDPMFNVAKSAFDGVFDRMSQDLNANFGRSGDATARLAQPPIDPSLALLDQPSVSDRKQSVAEPPDESQLRRSSVFDDRDPFAGMQQDMDRMAQRMEKLMGRLTGRQPLKLGDPLLIDSESAPTRIERVGGHSELALNGPSVDNDDDDGRPIIRVQMTPLSERTNWLNEAEPSNWKESEEEANWLACLAARARRLSSMTRWLVCVALFLCIVCMIWICMAIMRTAPRRRLLLIHRSSDVLKIPTVDSSVAEKKFLAAQEAKSPFIPAVHNSPPPAYEEQIAAAENNRALS